MARSGPAHIFYVCWSAMPTATSCTHLAELEWPFPPYPVVHAAAAHVLEHDAQVGLACAGADELHDVLVPYLHITDNRQDMQLHELTCLKAPSCYAALHATASTTYVPETVAVQQPVVSWRSHKAGLHSARRTLSKLRARPPVHA